MSKENLNHNFSRTAKKLRIPKHSLHYWRSKGLISHKPHDLDFSDLVRARFIKQCRENGISLQTLRKINKNLEPESLSQLVIYFDHSLALKNDEGLNPVNELQYLLKFEPKKEEPLSLELVTNRREAIEYHEKIETLELNYQTLLLKDKEQGQDSIENNEDEDLRELEFILKDITKLDPEHLMAWVELGNLYFKQNKFNEARGAYEQALEIEPECLEAMYNLANLHFRQKRYAVSIRFFQSCIKTDPNFEEAYYNFGLVLFHLRCFQAAQSVLEAYLKLDSNTHWSDQARLILEEIHGMLSQGITNKEENKDIDLGPYLL